MGLDQLKYKYRCKPQPIFALFLCAARLAYPDRYYLLCNTFGRSIAWLSCVFTSVCTYLANRFAQLLRWHPRLDYYEVLASYAEAIERRGYGNYVWGFIDGTFQGFCRPKKLVQQQYYSGYYNGHGLKYQAIVTPDGLICSLSQHHPGPWNDWRMLEESGVLTRLRLIMAGQRPLYLYGDSAYHAQWGILPPFFHEAGHRFLSAEQRAFNTKLSGARIAVENALGCVQNYFTRTSFSKAIQPSWNEPASFYLCSGLFTNFLTCLRGRNLTSHRFVCPPPDIAEYLML